MAVLVKRFMRVHNGGSKFYEIISLWNGDNDRGVLIKRWGKVAQINSGGQTQMDEFTGQGQMDREFRGTAVEKGRRGYTEVPATGPSRQIWLIGDDKTLRLAKPLEVQEALVEHYQVKSQADSIMQALNMRYVPGIEVPEDAVWSPEEPQPDRGESWGSW